jgi:Spy/CpxP family protein refolding chaperone
MQRISSLCEKQKPREEVVKFKQTKIALAGLLVLLASVAFAQTDSSAQANSAPAQQQGPGPRHFHRAKMEYMGRYLQLSDAQKAQVKQIRASEKPTIMPLMEQLHAKRQQLRALEQSGTFDEAKARTLAAEQSQILTNLTVERARIHSQIFNILTPEQKAKATELANRREERFQKRLQQKSEPAQ